MRDCLACYSPHLWASWTDVCLLSSEAHLLRACLSWRAHSDRLWPWRPARPSQGAPIGLALLEVLRDIVPVPPGPKTYISEQYLQTYKPQSLRTESLTPMIQLCAHAGTRVSCHRGSAMLCRGQLRQLARACPIDKAALNLFSELHVYLAAGEKKDLAVEETPSSMGWGCSISAERYYKEGAQNKSSTSFFL